MLEVPFVKLLRSKAAEELESDMPANHLLSIIARRAKRTDDFSKHGLLVGQALVGDYVKCNMTRQQYRGAIARLQKYGFVTIKTTTKGSVVTLVGKKVYDINRQQSNQTPTIKQPSSNHQATTKGSVVTLVGKKVYDINRQQSNQTPTIKQPSSNHQATTNKNERMKECKKKDFRPTSDEVRLSKFLLELILKKKPNFRQPDIQQWAVHIDRLIRLDRRTPGDIEAVIEWSRADDFWQNNILSTEKLRKQFDQLELRMSEKHPTETAKQCYQSGCRQMGTVWATDDTGQKYWMCERHKHKGAKVPF